MLQKIDDQTCECLITLLKRTRPGIKIYIQTTNLSNSKASSQIVLEITELNERGVIIRIQGCTVDDFFTNFGHLPLPPYIHTTEEKEKHYQTVFALQE